MKKVVDGSFRWMNQDGTPTQYFLELIQGLDRHTPTNPISVTSPTNGQVLIFNSTTGLYTPGSN